MFAIIPARSGSKRIKNKNIKIFNKKPMIYWVIKKLKKNQAIKKIVVTSDNVKILKLAKKYGADILIKRPKKLSNDWTPFQPVVKHSINYLAKKYKLKNILVVFPCSIFLKNSDIKKGLKLLKLNPKKFIISVSKYSHPIQRAYYFSKKQDLKFYKLKNELKRTQDFKDSYYDTGQFYLGTVKAWNSKRANSNAIGLVIPKERSFDIDNIEDWKFAEKMSKNIV